MNNSGEDADEQDFQRPGGVGRDKEIASDFDKPGPTGRDSIIKSGNQPDTK